MKIVNITLGSMDSDSRIKKEIGSQKNISDEIVVFSVNSNAFDKMQNGLKTKHFVARHDAGRILSIPGSGLAKEYAIYFKLLYDNRAELRSSHIYHCNDLDALLFGFVAKWFNRKAKIIYDAHEFETEQVENPNRLLHFLSVRLERFLVKRADAVITVSEGIASEYAKRYGIPKPRLVLNCPPFQVVRKSDRFREKFAIGKDQTIFLYQGGLLRGRGIENLMDVFSRAVRKDIVLVVIGSGPLEGQIRKAAERCGNIFFHPAVPSKELLSYTASADVGFLPYPNNCLNNYYCSPNKFFEYAMAGLPILVTDLPEMKRLVDMYRCGVVMASDTTEGVFAALEKIMAEDRSVYSANARKLAERYNWEAQEKVLLSVYREVLSCAG